jgi:hypothetical protein
MGDLSVWVKHTSGRPSLVHQRSDEAMRHVGSRIEPLQCCSCVPMLCVPMVFEVTSFLAEFWFKFIGQLTDSSIRSDDVQDRQSSLTSNYDCLPAQWSPCRSHHRWFCSFDSS